MLLHDVTPYYIYAHIHEASLCIRLSAERGSTNHIQQGVRVDFRQNGEQKPDSLEGCNSHTNFAEENWLLHTMVTAV